MPNHGLTEFFSAVVNEEFTLRIRGSEGASLTTYALTGSSLTTGSFASCQASKPPITFTTF
jgi:hypothetical protein